MGDSDRTPGQDEPRDTAPTGGDAGPDRPGVEPTIELGREEHTQELPASTPQAPSPTPASAAGPAGEPSAATSPGTGPGTPGAPGTAGGSPAYPHGGPPPPAPYGSPPGQQAQGSSSYPGYGYQGQPYGSYQGQPGYGPSQGGPPAYPGYPGYGYTPPGRPSTTNASTIVLLVLSGLLTASTCIMGLPSLVMSIIAITKQDNDPEGARRLTMWGWIVLAIMVVLGAIAIAGIIAWAVTHSTDFDSYTY